MRESGKFNSVRWEGQKEVLDCNTNLEMMKRMDY